MYPVEFDCASLPERGRVLLDKSTSAPRRSPVQQVAVVVQLVALLDWCGFCGALGVVLPTRAHPSCRKKVQERIRQRVRRSALAISSERSVRITISLVVVLARTKLAESVRLSTSNRAKSDASFHGSSRSGVVILLVAPSWSRAAAGLPSMSRSSHWIELPSLVVLGAVSWAAGKADCNMPRVNAHVVVSPWNKVAPSALVMDMSRSRHKGTHGSPWFTLCC